MRMRRLAEALDLQELTPASDKDEELTQGYTSDLLSDILAHAPRGGVLVTVQVCPDLITVACLVGARAVIFAGGRTPDHNVVERAAAEGLSLFVSQEESFEVVGRLYLLGLRGGHRPQAARPHSPRGHRQESYAEEAGRAGMPLPAETGG